jgi:hypothetical protein
MAWNYWAIYELIGIYKWPNRRIIPEFAWRNWEAQWKATHSGQPVCRPGFEHGTSETKTWASPLHQPVLSPATPTAFRNFSLSLQENSGIVPQIRPQNLPSTSLPIHCSLITMPFVSIGLQPELLMTREYSRSIAPTWCMHEGTGTRP